MPSTTFVLKEPTSKEETLVYLIFRFNNSKLKYSTGQKILSKFWNTENHRARETKLFKDHLEFNTSLNDLEAFINSRYRTLVNDGEKINVEILRSLIDQKLEKKNTVYTKLLIPFIEQLISQTTKGKNTVKNYEQTKKKLSEYEIAYKLKLKFTDIDLDFYNTFYNFCTGRGFSTNTIGNLIKNIKVFMNEALDRKLHNNVEYKNKRFKTVEEDSENIYLANKEIDILYNLNLEANSKLDKVRDVFIISCFTGLRYSDLIKLTDDNIIDHHTKLKIQTEKTGEVVIIPLHPYIRQIIIKHKGVPKYEISNQKMNDYLKDLGELAGLNEQVLISGTKGGIKISESQEKYKLITMHTARRSFATNGYLMQIPAISLMKLTGHKTEKAFLKYIKISQEENANKLINHPFFNL
ncbi:MAG: site-specific integrase [Ferruginibacter sp.]|uniref:site-specific integrase n=1 Tax=Ferruginibacter sp. TaxID=1940288 RepID=UPI00265B07A1|nr:site-specific integrase [Ferruginibacter sp.]MDB5275439.1 site-specific integrase [Ferruginibacter sp.]